jgi:hypothetical protein
MFQAQDPDARIKAADFLMTKFADTEFKPLAMFLTAESYERKGDFEKMTVWCEKTLEVDPKSYSCMLMLAGGIAKRARENDLDLNEKLDRSDKYAKTALEALKDAPSRTRRSPTINGPRSRRITSPRRTRLTAPPPCCARNTMWRSPNTSRLSKAPGHPIRPPWYG